MASAVPLLKLAGVSKDYVAAPGAPPVRVLRGVDLELQAGESLAVIGPSGSGKSTLLNIIGTLDRPGAGRVTFDGQDLGGLDDAQLAALRNRRIGFVFQAHHLLPHCTVLENVLVPTLAGSEVRGRRSEARSAGDAADGEPESRARRLLERVGLGERLHYRPGQLSGGERQRAAVVRALINQPRLVLADEPTGSLDHASALALGQLLVELNREQGVTLIVVTHALELARQMGGVMELRDGGLVRCS